MKNIANTFIGIIFVCFSCQPHYQAIEYGHDGCAYCKMTIMDSRYSAELVTDKGKAYKFDAVECMLDFTKENASTPLALTLVSTFNGKTMLSAEHCFYLHSRNLPSPMGMYITSISDKATAEQLSKIHGGKVYSWEELQNNFRQLSIPKPVVQP